MALSSMADTKKANYISQNKIHPAQELWIQNYQMNLVRASTDKFAFSFWHQN